MDSTWAYGARKRGHKKAIVIGLVIGLLTASGVAVAIWFVQGSGSGFTKASTLAPLTTENIPSADLPGNCTPGSACDVRIRIVNPNGGQLFLKEVTLAGNISSDVGSCDGITALSFNAPAGTGLNMALAPNATTQVLVPGLVTMSAGAPTSCQGARFEIPINFTAST